MTGISLLSPFAKLECLQPAHVSLPQCNVHKDVYHLLSIVGEEPKRAVITKADIEDEKNRVALAAALSDTPSTSNDNNEKKKSNVNDEHKDNDDSNDSDSDNDNMDHNNESQVNDEKRDDRIVVDIMDGKYPRRITCGIDDTMKEELLLSRRKDATPSVAGGAGAGGDFVYQVTIVEAPLMNDRRRDNDDLEDGMKCRATLLSWRRCDPADIPKAMSIAAKR
jgi:hypothetical protein